MNTILSSNAQINKLQPCKLKQTNKQKNKTKQNKRQNKTKQKQKQKNIT